jgi:TorA maturation chaperone TorD
MATPPAVSTLLQPEDQARAAFYALLARLYASSPGTSLLSAIASADELPTGASTATGYALAQAWRELIGASAAMDAEAIAVEYQDLFIGVGRSEISLYASAYMKSPGDTPLVAVRTALARLGLARHAGVNLYEDHLAAVCETMRVLIAGAGASAGFTLAQQRDFFFEHVRPWITSCCDVINANAVADYYRVVAQFTLCFMAIECDAMAIEH